MEKKYFVKSLTLLFVLTGNLLSHAVENSINTDTDILTARSLLSGSEQFLANTQLSESINPFNPNVKKLQHFLVSQRLLHSAHTSGRFNKATTNALKQYQKAHSLEEDGVFGGKTVDLVNREIINQDVLAFSYEQSGINLSLTYNNSTQTLIFNMKNGTNDISKPEPLTDILSAVEARLQSYPEININTTVLTVFCIYFFLLDKQYSNLLAALFLLAYQIPNKNPIVTSLMEIFANDPDSWVSIPTMQPLYSDIISNLSTSTINGLSSESLGKILTKLTPTQIIGLINSSTGTTLIKSLSNLQVSATLALLLTGTYTGGKPATYIALTNMGFTKDQIKAAYIALTDITHVDPTIYPAIATIQIIQAIPAIPAIPLFSTKDFLMTSPTSQLPTASIKLIQDFLTWQAKSTKTITLDQYGTFGLATVAAVNNFKRTFIDSYPQGVVKLDGFFGTIAIKTANSLISTSTNAAKFSLSKPMSTTVLDSNSKGVLVQSLQNFLTFRQFIDLYGGNGISGSITTLGPLTTAVLKQFQALKNINPTGIFDTDTITAANNALGPTGIAGIPNGIYMGCCGTKRSFAQNLLLQRDS